MNVNKIHLIFFSAASYLVEADSLPLHRQFFCLFFFFRSFVHTHSRSSLEYIYVVPVIRIGNLKEPKKKRKIMQNNLKQLVILGAKVSVISIRHTSYSNSVLYFLFILHTIFFCANI